MTTIKDLARHTGVSITTVSYVLNDTGTISEATRKKVLEAAELLNYHPNAFARNLKKNKSHMIGVFISAFGGLFYEDILEGIHDAILKSDYELIVCPDRRPVRNILTQRQADGAIVFDTKIKSEILLKLVSKSFPIVVMDRYLEAENLLSLLIDNQQGVKDAFYHLFDQGARRIDYISGARDSFDNMERMNAFLSESANNNVTTRCFEGNFTQESGYQAAKLILASHDLPDAVFCANDQMAIGLIKAMSDHNVEVPGEIAVMGFDDIQISQYIQPSLSTISASRFLWGSTAATQLIDFLELGKPFHSGRIPTKLVLRESSIINRRMVSIK